ncbi:MAG: ABC transporter substrate-binding protein, partial [Bacteroidota bacterium]
MKLLWIRGLVALLLLSLGCGPRQLEERGNEVIIRLAAEPDRLHPLLSVTGPSKQVELHLFAPLLQFDPQSLALVPVLAKSLPEIKPLSEGPYQGGVAYTFELREEATWDNGQAILATDYLFTIKALLNPEVPATPYRAYLNFLKDITVDPDNPRRFTVWTDRPYILAEAALGNLEVYPAHFYDPEGWLEKYSVRELADPDRAARLNELDSKLQRFAEDFRSRARSQDPKQLQGAGAYQLAAWEPGQRIVLQKKDHWWGAALNPEETLLNAYPDQIIFKIIPDVNAAVSLLKTSALDAMTGIFPEVYLDLQKQAEMVQAYQFFQANKLSYYYIGLNGNDSKLSDRRVRRSLAHLLDVDQIITTLLEGLAQRITGPIHPLKPYHHQGLAPIEVDLAAAARLLTEAGWTDSNGDGTVDRMIDGQKTELELTFKYISNNPIAADVGTLLKNNAQKVGVKVLLEGKVFNTLIKEYRKRDFDMVYLAWIRPPGLDDLRQSWHSSGNVPGGSNRTGFGNPTSDAVIDSIRTTYDPIKRKELYLRIQELIYYEQPYIFLFTPLECMAVHRRFTTQPS